MALTILLPRYDAAMIGIWSTHSAQFLYVAATLTLAFAMPMLVHPLAWARALRWSLPAQTDLTVYFGRCLGAVVSVVAAFGFLAARTPAVQPFYFALVLAMVALNIGVHLWGAFRKIQSMTETVEIGAWVLLLLAGLAFFPTH